MIEPTHPESHELASGVYDFIIDLESTQLFYYVWITIGVLFVFQFIEVTLTHVVALVISLLIVFYIDKKDKREQQIKMDDIYLKLHLISPRPKWFYIDSDVIELIDDVKEYREYNIVAWSRLIYTLDNFLEIVHDMELGVRDYKDNIDVAIHQKRIAIDNLQSILFKLPVDRALEYKLERAIYHLKLILQRHLDKMIHTLQKKNKTEGYNKFSGVYYFDHPEGLDNEKYREYLNYN